ncbi:ScbA/BarX family gamma-butyrolactone biosynthesis protein [Streptomyces sp. NPDC059445]|uniref:ScbA/BarX family gamma-butyrolactone biosynthesis protein n=1 Tax=Streptomyces sp. NPDC059445 TaxID=3346832 RepID=UPI00367DC792
MSLIQPSRAFLASDHGSGQGELSYLRTAPRHLVDRSAIADVLITDWQRTGADTFFLGAQWPRGHAFYTPIAGTWYDPLLAAESLRQASLLVGQTYYGIPRGHRWIVGELDIEVSPAALLLGSRPAEIRLEVARSPDPDPDPDRAPGADGEPDAGAGAGTTGVMTVEAELLRDDDAFVGAGRISLDVLSPAAYARLRGDRLGPPTGLPRLPEPLPPPVVGRLDVRDVVLGVPAARSGRGGHTWQLRVDPSHPALFDHPVDHVPAMLLLEAARQAAQAVCAPYRVLPIEVRSAFHRPVELDLACHIAATPLPQQDASEDTAVRVTASQSGTLVFDSLVVAALCD